MTKPPMENPINVFPFSAKTPKSLQAYLQKFHDFVRDQAELSLSNAAHTLQIGRKHFSHRQTVVATDREALLEALGALLKKNVNTKATQDSRPIILMFPGQGAQYWKMGYDLYREFPVFRKAMDQGFQLLQAHTETDFKALLYSGVDPSSTIKETRYAQPLIFIFEYALAQLLQAYGIKAEAMIGHSVGEYVAATLSGVWDYETALKLLVKRGQLMFDLPAGSMLSISLAAEEVEQYLEPGLDLATVNGPGQCVVSGTEEKIAVLAKRLKEHEVSNMRLRTSHAFHSAMMDPILEDFRTTLTQVKFNAMETPFISNRTGTWMSTEQAADPNYWVDHLRNAVLFSKGVETLLTQYPNALFLEVGPGRTLSGLVKQQLKRDATATALTLVRRAKQQQSDDQYWLQALGQVWEEGINLDWSKLHPLAQATRISLPTYAFERQKFPAIVDPFALLNQQKGISKRQIAKAGDFLYRPYWKSSYWPRGRNQSQEEKTALFFTHHDERGQALVEHLRKSGQKVVPVFVDSSYSNGGEEYRIDPTSETSYEQLFTALSHKGIVLSHIYHAWTWTETKTKTDQFYLGYQSLLYLARQIKAQHYEEQLRVDVITNRVWGPTLQTRPSEKAKLIGAIKVIPLEFPFLQCRLINADAMDEATLSILVKELHSESIEQEIAIDYHQRFVRSYESVPVERDLAINQLRSKGEYWIAGANSEMGQVLANYLAKNYQAKLHLQSASEFDSAWLTALQKQGAEVVCHGAMETLMNPSTNLLPVINSVHGVFYCTELEDQGGMIFRRKATEDQDYFKTKANTLSKLLELFAAANLDFLLVNTSRSSFLADPGRVGEAASDALLGHWAAHQRASYPVINLAWETVADFKSVASFIQQLNPAEQELVVQNCLHTTDIPQLLEQALYLGLPTQVISKSDLNERIYQNYQPTDGPGLIDLSTDALLDFEVEKRARPSLKSKYLAPSTAIEKRLVALLENFFGIEGLGVEDDLFELGIDSLKLMVLNRRLLQEFSQEIAIELFYEQPLIGGLAKELASGLIVQELELVNEQQPALNEIII